MKIFYSKKTGEIIGTVDGFGEDMGITITPSEINEEDIGKENIGLGHELEQLVRDFENPKKPDSVYDYKVKILKKKFNGLEKK